MKKYVFFITLLLISAFSACFGVKQAPASVPVAEATATSSFAATAVPVAAPTAVPATPVVPVQQAFILTAEPRVTPTPMPSPTPTPTPTPTPSPTPDGLIGGRYQVFSYEGEQAGEDFYRSENVSITVRHESAEKQKYKNYIEYHVADIYIQDITLLRAGCAGDSFNSIMVDLVPNMAQKYGSVFAVNGDYYSENPGLIVRNGIVYSRSPDSQLKRDICVVYRDGSVRTFARKTYSVEKILADGPWHTFNFGPGLLDEEGHAVKGLYLGKNANGINPRTIFGYYEPGHYAFITIDGRDLFGSRGLDMDTLARFAEDQGFRQAYNLDGGNSAVMCWHGEIYNKPSYGGRSISDILYIAPEGKDIHAEPADIPANER